LFQQLRRNVWKSKKKHTIRSCEKYERNLFAEDNDQELLVHSEQHNMMQFMARRYQFLPFASSLNFLSSLSLFGKDIDVCYVLAK